jgi:AraC-like DNA-binding protein
MFRYQEIPPEGDPSSRIQEFQEVLPRLLCCRYWWMSEWKSRHMSFPYWRFYWNRSGHAKVVYNKTYFLDPDHILLIPPNTPFATDIEGSSVDPDQPYSLKGGRVESSEMENTMVRQEKVLHLFIHFTLGYPFDTISPDVFVFKIDPEQAKLIEAVTKQLIADKLRFEQSGSLQLYSLLFSVLQRLPDGTWSNRKLDRRIMEGIRFMERHIREADLGNDKLAAIGGMSVNAYAKLFREQTGFTPRRYLIRMRVEKACNLLHHSDLSIEQIASECGFSDRYYFTRIFTRTMEVPPGSYRKHTGPRSG